jgi:polyhydroxyalkanoate synthesis regulator protein
MEIQEQMAAQSKGLYGTNQFAPEAWSQFMTAQTPMVQNMMNSYVEQSKSLFSQMQDKMQEQTRAMFSTFPLSPGSPGEKGKS